MSVAEDSRKVLQDFVAPELRAISARLDALERRVGGVDRKIDEAERPAEKRADQRHEAVMLSLRSLSNYNEPRDRVVRLESKESAHQ